MKKKRKSDPFIQWFIGKKKGKLTNQSFKIAVVCGLVGFGLVLLPFILLFSGIFFNPIFFFIMVVLGFICLSITWFIVNMKLLMHSNKRTIALLNRRKR